MLGIVLAIGVAPSALGSLVLGARWRVRCEGAPCGRCGSTGMPISRSMAVLRHCWIRTAGSTASPYVYRTADGYATVDLAVPSYNIES